MAKEQINKLQARFGNRAKSITARHIVASEQFSLNPLPILKAAEERKGKSIIIVSKQ